MAHTDLPCADRVSNQSAADRFQVLECAEWARFALTEKLADASSTDVCLVLERLSGAQTPDAAIFKFICVRCMFRKWEDVTKLEVWQKLISQPKVVQDIFTIASKHTLFVRIDSGPAAKSD